MSKYSRFFAILKQVNANGLALTKAEAVCDYTNKRTDSLSALSDQELYGLEQYLTSLTNQRQLGIPTTPEFDPKGDGLRKRIIAQFRSIGKTAQDAKEWAEKYGVKGHKRRFNDYTHQELKLLGDNAAKVKRDHIKSVTRRL